VTNPANHNKPWTPEDEQRLSWDWGAHPLSSLAERFGRTPMAIWRKADAMGLGRANRGHMTVSAFARYTGFTPAKIRKSAKALRINLRRGLASEPGAERDRTRDIMVDDEQQEKLIEFMMAHPFVFANEGPGAKMTRQGVWGIGKKPAACLRCQKTSKPHFARGYCKSCYTKINQPRKYKPTGNPRGGSYFENPVLNEEKVIAIREERFREGTSYRKLAEKYGVANPTIMRVVKGIDWKHVGGPVYPYTANNVQREDLHEHGTGGEGDRREAGSPHAEEAPQELAQDALERAGDPGPPELAEGRGEGAGGGAGDG
jgi:hypothetical protein